MLHLARDGDGVRRLASVALPERGPTGLVTMVTAIEFARDGTAFTGPSADGLADLLDQAVGAGADSA